MPILLSLFIAFLSAGLFIASVGLISIGKQNEEAGQVRGASESLDRNVVIPADFPADIPLLTNASVKGVATSQDGDWITFATDRSPEDSIAWYENELARQGWRKEGTYSAEGTLSMTFEKVGATLGILATVNESAVGLTTVTVTKSTD